MMDRTVLKNLRQQLKQERAEAKRLEDEYALEHAKSAMGVLIELLQEDADACRLLGDKSFEDLRLISEKIKARLPEIIEEVELDKQING